MDKDDIIRLKLAKLAALMPKDDKTVVFLGQRDGQFTGNVKHLFLYFARHRPDMKSYCVTSLRPVSKMLRCAALPTLLFPDSNAVEALASAGTIVVDNFDFKREAWHPLTLQARVIQLWHGVGFKKIGLVENESPVQGSYTSDEITALYSGYHTVVTTSPFYAQEVFAKAFRAEHFVDLGYPRNDALFKRPNKDSMLGCDTEMFQRIGPVRKSRRIVLYAPTFRDKVGNPIGAGTLDFKRLHDFLGAAGLHMVIKAHHLTDIEANSALSNISFYANDADVYPFLPMVDVMLTDYSSIYMDYLLLDRPVVFFCPDYDEYVRNNREFQFPYDAMTPGPKCRTQDELHTALERAATGDDGFAAERAALCGKAFAHRDGGSSRRIADYLCGPAPTPTA